MELIEQRKFKHIYHYSQVNFDKIEDGKLTEEETGKNLKMIHSFLKVILNKNVIINLIDTTSPENVVNEMLNFELADK